MTKRENILRIKEGLKPWAQENAGSVHVANDVPHLFKLLGDASGAPRAGILFVSQRIRDEQNADVTSRVDRKYWIALSRGYSLQSYPGKSLVEGIAKGAPMFDLIDSAETCLLGLTFDLADEPNPYYLSTELLNFEGVTMDAYRIEIQVAADICRP